jgi:hypothetical protein
MFKHDISQIEKFEDDLKKFAERAYPFATREMLNRTAFNAQDRIRASIDKKFVLRNAFTKRSIGVEKAGTLNVRRQESVVGSTAPYMEDQEFGTIKTRRGSKGVPLPTSSASGEGRSARPRRKLPTRTAKLSKIRLRKKTAQDIPAKIFEAARSGRKFVFLDLGRKKGIFRVKGRGRINESGFIIGIQLNMIWDLSRTTINVPRNPTIFPAAIESQKQQPFFYVEALEFQLKRQGLFKR